MTIPSCYVSPRDLSCVSSALALADEFQRLLDSGAVKRRADLARRFKLSRARVTQLMDLHKLHPDIRDFVRTLTGVGPRYISVRALRQICLTPHEKQFLLLQTLCPEFGIKTNNILAKNVVA